MNAFATDQRRVCLLKLSILKLFRQLNLKKDNYMEQSASGEACSLSDSQEIPHILWNIMGN
jgi:hypothetical protein